MVAEYSAKPIANPAPLGLSGFALTTFVLSLVNTGIATNTPNVVIGLAFFYGGLCQLLAGMWEFKCGNVFGATAFSSYGGFWLSFAAILSPAFDIGAAYTDGKLNTALGFFLLGWTIFTVIMTLGTLKAARAMFALFFFLSLTFLLLTIGHFASMSKVNNVAGWFGLITAFIAWYNAAAAIITRESSYIVLPLGHVKADA
ncbi:hypothetical protein K493DRAFT_229109 [Basidiobolus meristosporus CBS 931.73]|uniref:Uncharacterized protein n=1 Tax=Basidiobolus meristosporus CBS 931.73 TaxID=1314790 RepID=A0A1Y1XZU3_9FUNG|nr:hypothetical protein K493DRAFT_229109 [Basidiobolus meristosporus CBS 931.73]|eukprot:ORX90996.1 hypothetical protein K493DRAFT_229109 [Basidiobolus meristosporus CBS 931.73]